MKLPKIDKFFLETSLYERYSIDESDGYTLFDLIFFTDKLDCYCPFCEKESTFIGTNIPPLFSGHRINEYGAMAQYGNVGGYKYFLNKIHHINLYCSRVEKHKMQQTIYTTDTELFKIGQYPSIAEISQPELKKYRTVLSKEKYSELNRGVGLITHGIGIGSFVYLRRIFENLIEEAHKKISVSENWSEDDYQKSRMAEKIGLLQSELPEFLVENKSLYSILSKGIHELTENECMEYFPTVRLGIELILDEKLEKKKRDDKIKAASNLISTITKQIKDK
jgi:hypothetical protein